MAWTEQDKQAMDNAAAEAENDLASMNVDEYCFTTVADWWAKWVMTAGHKRLGRILLQYKSKEVR
jgi:hypothetical protein